MNYDHNDNLGDRAVQAARTVRASRELLSSLTENIRQGMRDWNEFLALGEVTGRDFSEVIRSIFETIIEERDIRSHGTPYSPEVVRLAAEQYIADNGDRIDEIKRAYQAVLDNDPQRIQSLTDWALSSDDELLMSVQEAVAESARHGKRSTRLSISPVAENWMEGAARNYIGSDGPEPGGRPFTQTEIEIATQQAMTATIEDLSLVHAILAGEREGRKDLDPRMYYDSTIDDHAMEPATV